MSVLSIPPAGLELPPTPLGENGTKAGMSIPQIIQLNLENGMLFDLMKAARHGARKPQLSFGRNMAIHYGHQQRALTSKPTSFPSFLYEEPIEDSIPLKIIGQFTHGLDLVKPEDDLSVGDSALAELQNSLALKEQAKQSHQITVLSKSSQSSASSKNTTKSAKNQFNKGPSTESLRKSALQAQPATHSLPSSPAMAPIKGASPPGFPSREQTAEQRKILKVKRLQALRYSLIHMVARRQASMDQIVDDLHYSGPEVKELVSKVCKPWQHDDSKWDLRDPSFKELEVWNFKYTEADRDIVIQRAIGAYDRMRISPNDPIFQGLLEPKDRNQGRSLSKLDHLNKGPIKPNATPKIKVQHPDESSQGQDAGRGRKKKSEEGPPHPPEREASQSGHRGSKANELDGQSKKPSSKGPTKVNQINENDKKPGKKGNLPLSAEFVNDSDEEDGLDEADGLGALSVPNIKQSFDAQKASYQKQAQRIKATKDQKPKKTDRLLSKSSTPIDSFEGAVSEPGARTQTGEARSQNQSAVSSISKTKKDDIENSVTKRKAPDAEPDAQKNAKRPRKSSSPHKPSPLGSSPPANASDMDGEGESSASSTPLMMRRTHQSHLSNASHANGYSGPVVNGASASLKRKIDDSHGLEQNGTRHSNSTVNGHGRAIKQARTNVYTPPTSDSPSPRRQNLPHSIMEKAQNFKSKFYPKYRKIYLEVQEMASPTEEKLDKLAKMQERIEFLKQEIHDEYAKHMG